MTFVCLSSNEKSFEPSFFHLNKDCRIEQHGLSEKARYLINQSETDLCEKPLPYIAASLAKKLIIF
jgi:hypothetical protein